jgi:glycosyltransferase involved in cell wall biosynthesis
MNGSGVGYLNYSFNILHSQTYKNFNIIISDNSKNDEIENLCKKWNDRLNIKYFRNREKYGMSQNTNFAIKKANGDFIKILYQDDFLFGTQSLELQLFHILSNSNHWLVTACCHTKNSVHFFNEHYPKYHDNIQHGENTISSPSVLMFKNENVIEFDENLCWLMDVDYYKRLYDRFGLPSICNYITVVNRIHEDQTSSSITKEIEEKEKKYTAAKDYKIS